MSQTATPLGAVTAAVTPQAASDMVSTPAAPVQPPIPPANTFDILPPLHALLSRLESGLESYTASRSAPLVTGMPPEPIAENGTDPAPLAYKDAAVAAGFIKQRIRKTLADLKQLGDMDRTIVQQEAEIKELEKRITQQRAVLAKLGRDADAKANALNTAG